MAIKSLSFAFQADRVIHDPHFIITPGGKVEQLIEPDTDYATYVLDATPFSITMSQLIRVVEIERHLKRGSISYGGSFCSLSSSIQALKVVARAGSIEAVYEEWAQNRRDAIRTTVHPRKPNKPKRRG